MIQFNAPAALGPPNQFMLTSEDATNALRIADYFIDVSVSGEGVLVTYYQT
jgi:hypothetical protein